MSTEEEVGKTDHVVAELESDKNAPVAVAGEAEAGAPTSVRRKRISKRLQQGKVQMLPVKMPTPSPPPPEPENEMQQEQPDETAVAVKEAKTTVSRRKAKRPRETVEEEEDDTPPPMTAASATDTTEVTAADATDEASASPPVQTAEEEVHPVESRQRKKGARGKKKVAKKTSAPSSSTSAPNNKNNFNFAGVHMEMLKSGAGRQSDCVFIRKIHRRRKYNMLGENHPLFVEHRGIRARFVEATQASTKNGTGIPHDPAHLPQVAPFATDEEVLGSLTEWKDSPALVYAQALWKYAPESLLRYAMRIPPPQQ